MVYTVTLNPALDYVMRVGTLRYDDINRSESEDIYYGGKGINVSTVLTRLEIENEALGFVGGFTGDKLVEMLKADGIRSDFNRISGGHTRINVKIKADTELDEMGAKNVLVSRGKDGATLVDENGSVTTVGNVEGKPVSSVGCGDSMVAGFVAGFLKKGDYAYALKLGMACGNATAFSEQLATIAEIDKMFDYYEKL